MTLSNSAANTQHSEEYIPGHASEHLIQHQSGTLCVLLGPTDPQPSCNAEVVISQERMRREEPDF